MSRIINEERITAKAVCKLSCWFVLVGNLCGSLIVRTFSLKKTCKKAAMFCFVSRALAVFTPLILIIPGCMNSNLAGVTEPYYNW